EGEREIQALVGSLEQSDVLGSRGMRETMPDQHREFFARLPFVLIGSMGGDGQPHASLLAGPPGFASSPDPRHLTVAALPHRADPLAGALLPGAALGVLGIEAHTRRRNRLNGFASEVTASGFTIEAQQSFGNCPKYIQARRATFIPDAPEAAGDAQSLARLDPAAVRMIAEADTFFIASAYPAQPGDAAPAHGVDVSHRGGKPGFVRIEHGPRADVLSVPDFSGNGLFNTLGNLAVHPRAGLLFVDYERGDVLHVATDAEIIWEGPELDSFAGAERLLQLHVRQALRIERALPLRWTEPELSPYLFETGDWI
ncbi:MAG TPA: pyridoxamine 5'-phosphate oxidase family protein, partial [Polyangiales bacterium]|nr:pyridoxamine 5'-phosphate oxidase family protein [Polyangiales bacterium]